MIEKINLICPKCHFDPMAPDEGYQDLAVFICPNCSHQVTPSTYVKEWIYNRQLTINGQESLFRRIMFYALIGFLAVAALAFYLT